MARGRFNDYPRERHDCVNRSTAPSKGRGWKSLKWKRCAPTGNAEGEEIVWTLCESTSASKNWFDKFSDAYYNKNVKTQTVATSWYLHLNMGRIAPTLSEPSVAADGSLHFALNCNNGHDNHVSYTNNPINILKCYMYHLLGKISREGSTFASIPHSRGCRRPSL